MGDCRPTLNWLGEYYGDRLGYEAFLKKGTLSSQATSMLRTALNQRRQATDDKLSYLAAKRGLTLAEFQRQILTGEASHLTDEEYKNLLCMKETVWEIEANEA